MNALLAQLEVLALDAQASGATPAHGDLLELGWARCGASGLLGPVRSAWITPRTTRPIRRAIRELTGWTEACLETAVDEREAWAALRGDVADVASSGDSTRAPAVVHFARFELPFLEDLYARLEGGGDFPVDAVCVHAVATRLFPDLPRRNIRALAGYLGHSTDLVRRAAGHVEATAFIWQALLPLLEGAGIVTWDALKAWLEETAPNPRRAKRVYPLPLERRRSLPDRPGVYRFVRKNGDVLYVGKAVSLRRRVASHFKSRGAVTERALELYSQVHDVEHAETESVVEAALLESDEIKRLDPPYNVQLRTGDRSAWFASRDFRRSVATPDAEHPVGPLPSARALSSLSAMIDLAGGAAPSPGLRAAVLAVPAVFVPEDEPFAEGWRVFSAEHLGAADPDVAHRVLRASLGLWLERGRAEPEAATDDSAPDAWDLARVRRRLERSLLQGGLLVRRARVLCFLVDANVAFREPGACKARCLCLVATDVVERCEVDAVEEVASRPAPHPRTLDLRRRCFDATSYDRARVLVTELRRVLDDGGDVAVRIGLHTFRGKRLSNILRGV